MSFLLRKFRGDAAAVVDPRAVALTELDKVPPTLPFYLQSTLCVLQPCLGAPLPHPSQTPRPNRMWLLVAQVWSVPSSSSSAHYPRPRRRL